MTKWRGGRGTSTGRGAWGKIEQGVQVQAGAGAGEVQVGEEHPRKPSICTLERNIIASWYFSMSLQWFSSPIMAHGKCRTIRQTDEWMTVIFCGNHTAYVILIKLCNYMRAGMPAAIDC
jgi:hypothetical protein